MSYRQQRTLSRRIIDTGQQPVGLPVLIQPTIAVDSAFGIFLLTFPIPVRVLGVPSYISGQGGTCNAATLVGDVDVELGFLGPAEPGNVLDIPAWDPAIRGLNGEWVSGGRYLIGGGAGGGFPELVYVEEVISSGANEVTWIMTNAYTCQSPAPFQINTIGGTSVNQTSPNAFTIIYASATPPGSTYNIAGPWNPGAFAPEGWAVASFGPVG